MGSFRRQKTTKNCQSVKMEEFFKKVLSQFIHVAATCISKVETLMLKNENYNISVLM